MNNSTNSNSKQTTTMTTYAASLIPALEAEQAANIARITAIRREMSMIGRIISNIKGEIAIRRLVASLKELRAELETLEYAVDYFSRVGVEFIAEVEARAE